MDNKQRKEIEKRALKHMQCWAERYRDAYIAFHYPFQMRCDEGIFPTTVASNYPNKAVWTQTVAL